MNAAVAAAVSDYDMFCKGLIHYATSTPKLQSYASQHSEHSLSDLR